MKRSFDLVISLIAVICLLPIIILVSILIKFSSNGGVVFYQTRVGLNGKVFNIYKFRTMVVNAEQLGSYYTEHNDTRITRIGSYLRKTSIDELPQLINVIKGDMSLVGPRPNLPRQKAEYLNSDWNKRNSVKPGITGLAQALSRSSATPEERLSQDLKYIGARSFMYDLWIIILTIRQIFLKGGN
ncbi:MAG: sugar transferase [Moritella sp.]|uniref:sugar transferase n=1 Tax=Moritella sp. TaxID=78556 RepID=UPI001DD6C01B|nr:sugar transferase [Moritella sp.]NQZ51641.1 sugar transferase [Moritella sp.]